MNATAPKPGAVKRTAALREASAAVVQCLYRLVKGCLLHTSANNESVTASSKALIEAVLECCRHGSSEDVTVLFMGDAVFVNGAILRTSREAHAIAVELGTLLAACNVRELTLARILGQAEVVLLGTRLADVWRDRSLGARFREVPIPGVTLSEGKAFDAVIEELAPSERVTRTYAAAVMTVRGMLADVQRGEDRLPRRVKRLAQKIVAHADEDGRLLVSLASQGGPAVDPSTIAVGTAILTVAMARQLTTERVLLSNAAMAALLLDAGKARLSVGMGGVTRKLNDDELDLVPASAVAVSTAMGKLHPASRVRGALVYEAWWLRRAYRIGPLYAGRRTATVLSRIIGVARAFCELRAAGPEGTLSVDDALQVLMNRATDTTESAFVRLLIGALGVYPAGTMVELSSGELAVVMATPELPMNFARPPVKVMYDRDARLLAEPVDVDLGAPAPGRVGPAKFILRAVHADDQQLRAMRSFVVAATAANRRAAVRDPMPEHARAASAASTARPRSANDPVPEPGSPRSRPSPTSPSAAHARPEASGVHASAGRRPSVELPRAEPAPGPPPPTVPVESAPRRLSYDRLPRVEDPRSEATPAAAAPPRRPSLDRLDAPPSSGGAGPRRDPRLDPDDEPPRVSPASRGATPPPLSRGATPPPGSRGATPPPGSRGATPPPGSRGATPPPGSRGETPPPGSRGATPPPLPRGETPPPGSRGATPPPLSRPFRTEEAFARGGTPSPRSVKPSRIDEALARGVTPPPGSAKPSRIEEALARAAGKHPSSERLPRGDEPPRHESSPRVDPRSTPQPAPAVASSRPATGPAPQDRTNQVSWQEYAERLTKPAAPEPTPPPASVRPPSEPAPRSHSIAKAAVVKRPISRSDSTVPPPAVDIVRIPEPAAAPPRGAAGGERTSQVNWEQYTDRLSKAARAPEDVARDQRDALLAAFLAESQEKDKKDKR